MAVKIRLQRKGRKKAPFYHIVIADARSPRDGKFIEKIGTHNPMTVPASINLNADAAYSWLEKGAQATDTVRAILGFKGVLYKKHLMRGVKKGAFSVEEADAKHKEWLDAKTHKITTRIEKKKEEDTRFHQMISGTAKAKKVVEEPKVEEEIVNQVEEEIVNQVEETVENTAEEIAPVVNETIAETMPEVTQEETPEQENEAKEDAPEASDPA